MGHTSELVWQSRPGAYMSKLTRIHFIRHGETDWNAEGRVQGQSESVLTEQGVTQARRLAGALRSFNFGAIYCSSSVRAQQTAAIVFAHRSAEIIHRDELREIHLGPWEGLLYRQVAQLDPQQHVAFRQTPHLFRVPGAETFAELQQRSSAAVKEIGRNFAGQEVALVSHGAWIRSVLVAITGKTLQQLWEPPAVSNCAHIIIDTNGGGAGRVVKQVTDQHWV